MSQSIKIILILRFFKFFFSSEEDNSRTTQPGGKEWMMGTRERSNCQNINRNVMKERRRRGGGHDEIIEEKAGECVSSNPKSLDVLPHDWIAVCYP